MLISYNLKGMKNKLIIKDIALSGTLVSLIIFLNLISSLFPIILGYSADFYLIIFAITLVILRTYFIKFLVLIFVPCLLLLFSNVYWINLLQVLFEYFFSVWCFFPFMFGNNLIQKTCMINNKKITITILFSILFVFCWTIKMMLHVLAGYYWWTSNNWSGSFAINFPLALVNIILTIPIFIMIFPRTLKGANTYYSNIWDDQKS